MLLEIKNLRPLHDDIIVKRTDLNKVQESSLIYVKDNHQNAINFFEVLAVGSDVEYCKVGDIVAIGLGDHMLPVEVEGMNITTTSEKMVKLILDKD